MKFKEFNSDKATAKEAFKGHKKRDMNKLAIRGLSLLLAGLMILSFIAIIFQ